MIFIYDIFLAHACVRVRARAYVRRRKKIKAGLPKSYILKALPKF